jgi:hypothetical protein
LSKRNIILVLVNPIPHIATLVAVAMAPPLQATALDSAESSNAVAVAETVSGILAYSHWPPSTSPINLCLVGASRQTSRIADRTLLNGRPMIVRRLSGNVLPVGHGCDAVYVGTVSAAERSRLIAQVNGQAIVTIVENDPNCLSGMMFCLQMRGGALTFELNFDAVSRSRVRVDPRVLALARRAGNAR